MVQRRGRPRHCVATTKFEIHIAGSVYEVLKQGAVAELLCERECAIAFSCRLLIPNKIRVEANIKRVVSAYPDALGLCLNRSLKKR